jgi:hypothetical protein
VAHRAAGSLAETQSFAGLDQISRVVEREQARSSPSSLSSLSSPPAETGADDAESLESYLGRFMERMTGNKPQPAAGTSATIPVTPPEPESVRITVPREAMPPPECRQQMAALRELANQNAHNALIRHACGELKVRARSMFLMTAAVSLVSCGTAVVAMAAGSLVAQIGSIVCGALALVLGCRFLRLCREHRRRAAEFEE